MNGEEKLRLEQKAREIRYLTMDEIGKLGVGHVGGSLSIVEALVILYYRHMNVDPGDPQREGRDRFVLSKGHAGPVLYAVLADKGYFDKSWLDTLNRPGTRLPSHADMLRTPGVDMTAGALGQGISCAVGLAIGAKMKKDGARVYCIVGDGEIQEGQVWEAAMYASQMALDNMIVFVDYNKMQLDGTIEEVNNLEPIEDKWRAFGWRVLRVDGHDFPQLDAALQSAKDNVGSPTVVIMDTVKGKGVSFVEAMNGINHNIPITAEQHAQALAELK